MKLIWDQLGKRNNSPLLFQLIGLAASSVCQASRVEWGGGGAEDIDSPFFFACVVMMSMALLFPRRPLLFWIQFEQDFESFQQLYWVSQALWHCMYVAGCSVIDCNGTSFWIFQSCKVGSVSFTQCAEFSDITRAITTWRWIIPSSIPV